MTGQFVVFEGGDASGKTTQARRVARQLGAIFTREPGGTDLGETLRSLVLEPTTDVDLRAEALMIAAARAQHVAEVIRPTIEAGQSVVCDRFTGSSLAYQGFGSGLEVDVVRQISEFATAGLSPDITVLIDVPTEVSLGRLGEAPDRFEREAGEFHARVRAGYLELADADPTWIVIDGSGTVDEVGTRVDTALETLL